MAEDFLNFSLIRTLGLPNEDARFDAIYQEFETDLLEKTYTLSINVRLHNIADHQGFFPKDNPRLRFFWAILPSNVSLKDAYLRDRTVPLFEMGADNHHESVKDQYAFIAKFKEKREKNPKEAESGYLRAESIAKRIVFALRLLSSSPVYSDCVYIQRIGHLSLGPGSYIAHRPDERISLVDGEMDLQARWLNFERLFNADRRQLDFSPYCLRKECYRSTSCRC